METKKTEVYGLTSQELLAQISTIIDYKFKSLETGSKIEEPVTINEVAAYTKQSKSTIRKLIDERAIPFTRFRGKNSTLLFFLSEIRQLLINGKVEVRQKLDAPNIKEWCDGKGNLIK